MWKTWKEPRPCSCSSPRPPRSHRLKASKEKQPQNPASQASRPSSRVKFSQEVMGAASTDGSRPANGSHDRQPHPATKNRQRTHLDLQPFFPWMDLLPVRMELPAPHAPQRSRSQDRLRPPGRGQIPRSQMCRPPLPPRFRRRCRQLHPPHPQTGHPRLQAQRRSRTLPPGNRPRVSQPTKNPGPGQSRRRRLPPPRPRRPDLENVHVGTAASAVRPSEARRRGAPLVIIAAKRRQNAAHSLP
jgi:hypothetical protein